MKKANTAPTVSEFPPGPRRRFRKTIDELSHEFVDRLRLLKLKATAVEVREVIEGRCPPCVLRTIIEDMLKNEIRRGVELVP